MNEKNDQIEPDALKSELPLQSAEIGFREEELITCQKCARANPPTRLNCFYCGAALEVSAEQAAKIAPVLRKLEIWEKGFNLILRPPDENFSDPHLREIGRVLHLDADVLRRIVEARKFLPLARAESTREAEILQRRLSGLGIETLIVADEKLAPDAPPRRLRGLRFEDGKLILILFNGAEIVEIAPENLCLLVAGAVFQKTVEATEKRKKGESKILETSETASDEILLDIYERADTTGFRILVKGFDFSCLGAEKGILARENIKKLIARLQRFAPSLKLVDDYLGVREILGNVWEIEQRKDSLGLKRQSFGKFDLTNTLVSNNLQQFTKYSRFQRLMI